MVVADVFLYIGGLAVAEPQKSISAEAAKAKYVISPLQPQSGLRARQFSGISAPSKRI